MVLAEFRTAAGAAANAIVVAKARGSSNLVFSVGAAKLNVPDFWRPAFGGFMFAALTVDAGGVLSAYSDGRFVDRVQGAAAASVARPFARLGFGTCAGMAHVRLDEIRVLKVALNEANVYGLYAKIQASRMHGHWDFNGGPSTTAVRDTSTHCGKPPCWNGQPEALGTTAWSNAAAEGPYCLAPPAGRASFVRLPDRRLGGPLTVAFWLKLRAADPAGKAQPLVDLSGAGAPPLFTYRGDDFLIKREAGSDAMSWTIQKGAYRAGSRPAPATARTLYVQDLFASCVGSWEYFAFVVDGAGVMSAYKQGVLAASLKGQVPPVVKRAGKLLRSMDPADGTLQGAIDDVAVYAYALSASEVFGNFDALAERQMALHLPFDEGAGVVGYDVSGNARNAALTKEATHASAFKSWYDNSNSVAGTTSGQGRYALRLSSNSYAKLPTMTFGGALSVACWLRLDGFKGGVTLLDASNGGKAARLRIASRPNTDDLVFEVTNGGQTKALNLADFFADAHLAWIHVAFVITGTGSMHAYREGILYGSALGWTPYKVLRSQNTVGRVSGALTGALDDFRLWPFALTSQAVFELFDRQDESEMVFHYKLDSGVGQVALDASGHGLNGKLTGGAAFTTKKPIAQGLSALALPAKGGSGVATGVTLPPLTFGGAVTVSVWVRLGGAKRVAASGVGKFTVYDFGNGLGADNVILSAATKNGVSVASFEVFRGVTRQTMTCPNFWKAAAGAWAHVVFTVAKNSKGVDTAFAYLNGKKHCAQKLWSPAQLQRTASILGGSSDPSKSSDTVAFELDDARFYPYAITAAEAADLFSTVDKGGMIAHLTFDEGAGSVAYDTSAHLASQVPLNGALINMSERNWSYLSIQGRFALAFDGANDYVQLPSNTFGGAFTISAWVRFDSFRTWSRVVDLGNGQASDNILIANKGDTNDLRFEIFRGGASKQLDIPNFFTKCGAMCTSYEHIAVTCSRSGVMKAFRAGALVGSTPGWTPKKLLRRKNYIGHSNWANDKHFDGAIDDLQIFPLALPEPEIHNIYAGIEETNMVSHYTFETGSGKTVMDVSGHDNDGTMSANTKLSTAWSTDAIQGRYALHMDGAKTFVALPPVTLPSANSGGLKPGAITISFWARFNSFNASTKILSLANSTTGSDIIVSNMGGLAAITVNLKGKRKTVRATLGLFGARSFSTFRAQLALYGTAKDKAKNIDTPKKPPTPCAYCACAPITGQLAAKIKGKIALVQRGNCYFVTKVKNVVAAGGIGIVIFNHSPGLVYMATPNNACRVNGERGRGVSSSFSSQLFSFFRPAPRLPAMQLCLY